MCRRTSRQRRSIVSCIWLRRIPDHEQTSEPTEALNCGDVKLAAKAEVVRKSAADRRTSSSLVPGTKYNLLRSDLAEVEDATPLRSVRM